MNIHEHQAKELLKSYGIPVPKGFVIFNQSEIKRSIEKSDYVINLIGILGPTKDFFKILKKTVYPGLYFDKRRETLSIDIVRYSINGLKIEQKSNYKIAVHNNLHTCTFNNKHIYF